MPQFNVESFVAELKEKGFSKPYLFQLWIPGLMSNEVLSFNDVGREASAKGDMLRMFVKSTSIPQSTVNVISVPHQGRIVKLPGERVFNEWTFNVFNDEKYKIRRLFEDWHHRISDVRLGKRQIKFKNKLSNLLQDIRVDQLSPSGDILKTYVIEGAFPSTLSQMDFNWESTSNTQDFTVTIAYQYYYDKDMVTEDINTVFIPLKEEIINPIDLLNPFFKR